MDASTSQQPQTFGELLHAFRIKSGYSQETLAELAGMSLSGVGALEQGIRRSPYRHTIGLISDALGLLPAERKALEESADRARARTSRKRTPIAAELETNLPRPMTTFVERAEVEAIAGLADRYQLVTITGSGGVGKTRTAIEVATRRARETGTPMWFLDLEPVRDGRVIAAELAAVLNVQFDSRDDSTVVMFRSLKSRSMSLVIDNCEHLVNDVAQFVEELLHACPLISVLATSRERLGLSSEIVYRLPSLQIEEAATELFISRAQAADAHLTFDRSGVEIVSDICRELDGIPLAIELAAARTPAFGLAALRSRLRDNLSASDRDRPQRHQTMAAAINWSIDLLGEAERKLLRRVSVFVGGFTLEAAEDVCSDAALPRETIAGLLAMLVQKSLVHAVHVESSMRYSLLNTIRTHAADQLAESGERELMLGRHVQWVCAGADAQHWNIDPGKWILDFDNIRSAITRCGDVGDTVSAVLILGSFRRLWMQTPRRREFRTLVAPLLPAIDETVRPEIAARAHFALQHMSTGLPSIASGRRAIALFRLAGDELALAVAQSRVALELARIGRDAEAASFFAAAASFYERTPYTGDYSIGFFLTARAWFHTTRGNVAAARHDLAIHTKLIKATSLFPAGAAQQIRLDYHLALGELEFAIGNVPAALDATASILQIAEDTSRYDVPFLARSNAAAYHLAAGNVDEAETLCRIPTDWDEERLNNVEMLLQNLSLVCARKGHAIVAARTIGFVDAWYRRSESVRYHTEQYVYDALMESLHRDLSDAAIETEMRAGETLSLGDVKAAVFGALDSPANEPGPMVLRG
jgi:predicted ATPase/DNA-binding XRE family transcriptional regulator